MLRTSNYDLCQYEGSDKTSYLINYNGDMLKIDTAIKAAKDAADAAQAKADTADGKADINEGAIATLNTQINGASGIASDVATVQGAVNTINSLIGNGEPTTTDKTLIGAINELNSGKADSSDVGNLENLTTTDKSSIVGAINEVVASVPTVNGRVYVNDIEIEVAADGVKTLAQLVTELKAKALTDLVGNVAAGHVYELTHFFSNNLGGVTKCASSRLFGSGEHSTMGSAVFDHVRAINNGIISRSLSISDSNDYMSEVSVDNTNAVTFSDKSAVVPADGQAIHFTFRHWQKI